MLTAAVPIALGAYGSPQHQHPPAGNHAMQEAEQAFREMAE